MALKKLAVFAWMLLAVLMLAGCGEKPFRLHIIANSDSPEDQSVKLAVRDEILAFAESEMKKVNSKMEAKEYIGQNLEIIEKKAEQVLKDNGFTYSAKAYVGKFDFPSKTYGDATYPAGEYDALRIVLGEGEGQNWWCVIFPPLCLAELSEEQQKALEKSNAEEKIEYVSFFGELWENWFGGGN